MVWENSASARPLRQSHDSPANAAAALRVEHLLRVSSWAAEAVPPLGALLGARLVATCESVDLPLPATAWTCKRCESVLIAGVNCSLQSNKRSIKKHKLSSAYTEGTDIAVYKCGYCGRENVKVKNVKSSGRHGNEMKVGTSGSLQKSPHVIPRASSKTSESLGLTQTPSPLSVLTPLVSSTGGGRKRKRKGWLTLSELTKQSNSQSRSPCMENLAQVRGAALMPRFDRSEFSDVKSKNAAVADVDVDLLPHNTESVCSMPQPVVSDPLTKNTSTSALIASSVGCLIEVPTGDSFERETKSNKHEASLHNCFFKDIISNGNMSGNKCREASSARSMNELSFESGPVLQKESHEFGEIPSGGALETGKALLPDLEIPEDNISDFHDIVKGCGNHSFSTPPESSLAGIEIVEEERKLLEENFQIDSIDFKAQVTTNSNTSKSLDIQVGDVSLGTYQGAIDPDTSKASHIKVADTDLEEQTMIYSQNDSQFVVEDRPVCSSDVVEEIRESIENFELGNLAREDDCRSLEVGVQCCLSLKEDEAPHKTTEITKSSKLHSARILAKSLNRYRRDTNGISITNLLRRIISLKRQLHMIPILKQEICNLSAQIAHLQDVCETHACTNHLATERSAGPSSLAMGPQNLEALAPQSLTISPRTSPKEQIEPEAVVENPHGLHHVEPGIHETFDETFMKARGHKEPNLDVSPLSELTEGLEGMSMLKTFPANPRLVNSLAEVSQTLDLLTGQKALYMEPQCQRVHIETPLLMSPSPDPNCAHQVLPPRSKRRKVFLDNAIWNGLYSNFPFVQPGKRLKAYTCLYKIGRKWRIGTRWR